MTAPATADTQPVEEAALRPEFAEALGLGAGWPDLVVRFGQSQRCPDRPGDPLKRCWCEPQGWAT